MFQALLHLVMISCWVLVPERQLRVRWEITRGAHDLQVADEAAMDIASAVVVYSGGQRPDATGAECFLGASDSKMGFSGGKRAAKAVECDDSFNQETAPKYTLAFSTFNSQRYLTCQLLASHPLLSHRYAHKIHDEGS